MSFLSLPADLLRYLSGDYLTLQELSRLSRSSKRLYWSIYNNEDVWRRILSRLYTNDPVQRSNAKRALKDFCTRRGDMLLLAVMNGFEIYIRDRIEQICKLEIGDIYKLCRTAALWGKLEIFKLLFSINVPDVPMTEYLFLAIWAGQFDLTVYIVETEHVQKNTTLLQNAFVMSFQYKDRRIIEYLHKLGGNLYQRSSKGVTPFQMCLRTNVENISYLTEHGYHHEPNELL